MNGGTRVRLACLRKDQSFRDGGALRACSGFPRTIPRSIPLVAVVSICVGVSADPRTYAAQ
jgi:hypothetical protein